ncbi:TMEM175 family protein [Streptomyces mirabilis]|uniref:TMEM175 family protein n=1 Tax=Streptomyces mirabilis TaxID=68239 RepID=UPI0036289B65
MTLLVINVAIPAHLDDAAFHKALRDALPHLGAFALIAFALSLTLIAGFWRDHRRILTPLPTEPAVITRLTLLGLDLVALLLFPWPSSTREQPCGSGSRSSPPTTSSAATPADSRHSEPSGP